MRTSFVGPFFSLFAIAAFSTITTAQSSTQPAAERVVDPPLDPNVLALVKRSANVEPDVAEPAIKELTDERVAIFPELARIARSQDPNDSTRAEELLEQLPWDAPDDPPHLHNLLHNFGSRAVADRRGIVHWLAAVTGPDRPAAWRALGRILLSDPDNNVLWDAVTAARVNARGDSLGYGKLELVKLHGPVKIVIARMYRQRLTQLASQMMIQILREDAAAAVPTDNHEEVLYVLGDLLKSAPQIHNEAEVAAVLRLQYPLMTSKHQPKLRRELYALHADRAIDGFAQDCRTIPPDLNDPGTIYALARIENRLGHKWSAAVIRELAFVETSLPAQFGSGKTALTRHVIWGQFLAQHQWLEETRREMGQVLADAPADDVADRSNAHLAMLQLESARGQNFSAAEHARAIIVDWKRHPIPVVHLNIQPKFMLDDDLSILQVQMNWNYLRAAIKTLDLGVANRTSLALAKLKPIDDEILLDAYPQLTHNGHLPEAQSLFDANYNQLKKLAAGGTDVYVMYRLAWLCGNCGQHLDEAEQLARKAIELQPDDPNCVIALAEIERHRGKFAEAIRLAEQAVKLSPNDPKVKEYVVRYRAEAANPPPAP